MSKSKGWSERQAQILEVLSMMSDGARPNELAAKLDITTLYAAILLSRYRKQGILVKRVCDDGKCRYLLSSKGERKNAYLESLKE